MVFPTEESLNRNLSQYAQEELNEVSAGDKPDEHRLSWTDLYVIFRNSRRLVKEAQSSSRADWGTQSHSQSNGEQSSAPSRGAFSCRNREPTQPRQRQCNHGSMGIRQ
jgi:hypothetical protein